MQGILADVVAEQQALDQYLQSIHDRDWAKKTPYNRWTVHQHVAHLAAFEDYALDAIDGKGALLAEANAFPSFDHFVKDTANLGPKRSQEVIEWWRLSRAAVIEALSRRDSAERVPWFAGKMAVKTFATSRLVETWLHGLDVHHTFGTEPDELPRLRHVAHFAWMTLPYAFKLAGEDFSEPLRLELVGPNYTKWLFGPEDSPNFIKGRAGEWCRVAVGRLQPEKAESLVAEGAVAKRALSVVRTFV